MGGKAESEKKDKTSHFMINSEGKKKKKKLKVYQKYCKILLQARPSENLQEEKTEQEINVRKIIYEPKVEKKETTQLKVKKVILKMKITNRSR